MKYLAIGLALLGANLISAQGVFPQDSVSMYGDLSEISLCCVIDSTIVDEKNIFIPLEQLIQKTEGANLISRGNFAQDPMLRVYKGEQINVTLNGMRMFGACTDRMDPVTSYAETSNLKSISVTQSGQADLSGNAHGGSLSMNLKEASFSGTPKTGGLIGARYSSNTSGYNLFGQLDHQNKKWGLYLQASTRKHQNYYAGGNEEILYSQYQKVNATANFAYKISHKEVLKVNFLYDKAEEVGYPALPMDVGIAEAIVTGAHYQNFVNSKKIKSFEAMLYYNSIYHEMDDTKRPNVPMHMDMPGWSKTLGAWIKVHSQELKKHRVSLMAEYYQNFKRAEMTMYPENEAEMFMLTWPDVMRITGGLGLTDNWVINPKLQLNSSLRLDYNHSYITTEFGKRHLEVFGYNVDDPFGMPIFSWKENLSFKVFQNSFIDVNLAYAERAPDVSEQFGFYLFNANDGYDYIGNPDILKEQAVQIELGFSQNFNKFSWGAKGYAHHIENYILGRTDSTLDAMTIGANGVRVYENLPFARIYGVEANAKYNLSKYWVVSTSAQYSYGNEASGEPLPLIAPLKGFLTLGWRQNNWYASSDLQWAAEQTRVNQNFGDLPTPGYGLINATLGKDWLMGKLKLKTEIQATNLLDTYYRDHLSWGQIPQMGRNVNINLVLNF